MIDNIFLTGGQLSYYNSVMQPNVETRSNSKLVPKISLERGIGGEVQMIFCSSFLLYELQGCWEGNLFEDIL